MKKSSPVKRKARTTKKLATKKAARRPHTAAKKAPSHGRYASPPSGYTRTPGSSVIMPVSRKREPSQPGVVPASKLQSGIAKAREQISGVLHELVDAARENYEVTEIELSASFSADGKFLGFGVGGEMSITFKVRPVDEA
jgi:hypothetical protein